MTKKIYQNLQKWRNFAIKFHYNFLMHNDNAIDYLLNSYSELYNPMLQQILYCGISPTIKIDIWRGIVLYVYGGIYTDIDNAPGKNWIINATIPLSSSSSLSNNSNESNNTITTQETMTTKESLYVKNTDEAFFVVERGGWLSQYFMASKSNHILMRILVDQCMERLLNETDIYHLYIPRVTGPGALKFAFIHYMNQSYHIYQNHINPNVSTHIPIQYTTVREGYFISPMYNNTSVTIAGNRRTFNDIVYRDSIGSKKNDYISMNMTDYHTSMDQVKNNEIITCRQLIIQNNNNYNDSSTMSIDNNNDISNNYNYNESMIDQQIEVEIKLGSPDITRQYLFYDEEIYHVKYKANIEYKMSWLLTVQTTRKYIQQLKIELQQQRHF